MFKDGDKVRVVSCTCICSPSCGHDEENKDYLNCVGEVTKSSRYIFNVKFDDKAAAQFYITQLQKCE